MADNYGDAINDISTKLSSLKEIPYKPTAFGYPYTKITNVRETGAGTFIAKITLGILKTPAKVQRKSEQSRLVITSAKKYWDDIIALTCYNSKVTNTLKASSMIEFKQDIRKIYPPSLIKEINFSLDYLYKVFAKLHKIRKETENFPMPVNFIETDYEPINKSNTVLITNLLSFVFLDKKTVKKLDNHDLARKFSKNIPFEAEFVTRIEWFE